MDIFVAEHICRKILAVDEFYFAQRPILGRGRGCAATWKANKNGRASEIVSTFIPEYEFQVLVLLWKDLTRSSSL